MEKQWENLKHVLHAIEDGWTNYHNIPHTYEGAIGSFKHLRNTGYTLSIIGSIFQKKKREINEYDKFIDFKCIATECTSVLRVHDANKMRPKFFAVKQMPASQHSQEIIATVELVTSHTCSWVLAQSRALKFFDQLRGFNGALNSFTGIYVYTNMAG